MAITGVFAKIKENKSKVAKMVSYTFPIKGIISETEKAICFLINNKKKGLIECWIPKSVIVNEEIDHVSVNGKFVSENMWYLVDIKSL